ncbi:MAG: Asp-tRNA(Asn)/Glu-tRNA(Gln) amidotransferase subunit GatC [Gammaproteobacteria bacterium]
MAVTEQETRYIAHLARLRLSDQEIPQYNQFLINILDSFAQLDQIKTDVMPMAHPLNLNQPLRSDEVTKTDQHELFQSNAPSVEVGLYLVPKVIE